MNQKLDARLQQRERGPAETVPFRGKESVVGMSVLSGVNSGHFESLRLGSGLGFRYKSLNVFNL